jgi:alpha-glucosidase
MHLRFVVTIVCALFTALAAARAGVEGGQPATMIGEMLSSGAARFMPPGMRSPSLPPSMAVSVPQRVVGGVPDSWKTLPKFYSADGKLFGCVIDIAPGTSLYGTGEVAGPLLRNGRSIVCWNTDAYGYTDANPSLYQSHPWVLAVRADGTAFGVLADTTWRCTIDLRNGIEFIGEGEPFPVYILEGNGPADVVAGLSRLVGTIPLPPKWAIGYHQCRYSYNPESRVREIAEGFRSRKIPCDVIWFDIDYMDGYRVFTFDSAQFPDPKKLNEDLGKMGFERIWMIDPGVKAEPGYFVYDQMIEQDLCVRTKDGEIYKGEVWPGVCVFPDYTRPDVRAWWAGLYKDFMATGISGVWNDMNEPAVFNVPSKTMPEDNVHKGGRWDAGGTLPEGPHLRYHNVYGMLMAKGTYDGILATRPDKRPFVLTRAGFMGSHRYAATWTGDNSAEWDDLEDSISMALNLGLSGQPFAGPDIGGFNGNGPGGEANGKLFARWMGIGALLPFARGHTGKGNIDKEPWAFGPEVEKTCRQTLERRYRLMPYLYTTFFDASQTGLPVARPLFFADPADPALRSEDDAFLLGPDILVVGRVTPLGDREVVLPRGAWRAIELVGEEGNPDLPELLVRPGAIVPCGPVMEWTSQAPLDPLTLIVNLNEQGSASGTLYEDAGDGFGYMQGEFLLTQYTASRSGSSVNVRISSEAGNMPRPSRKVQVVLLGDGGKFVVGEGEDGKDIVLTLPE